MINLKKILINLDENFNNLNKRSEKDSQNLKKVIDIFKEKNINIKNLEKLKFQKNQINKKKFINIEEKQKIIVESKEITKKISELEKILENIEHIFIKKLYEIPNIPHSSVKIGKNSEENEIFIKNERELKEIDISHEKILRNLNWVFSEEGVKLSQSKFVLYKNESAKLLRILKNYMLDYHIKNSYKEIFAPNIVNEKTLWGTGQFPKMISDCYKIEDEDLYLIPTSEVTLINFCANKLFEEKDLPLKLCSYSLCFRKEAGSYGQKTKGLIRLHQFNKVEIVQITKQENSYKVLDEMLEQILGILKELKIPYRVVNLCSGDLGFSSSKTYDVEVWMPSKKKFVEISSISNTEIFQSNSLNIKYKDLNGKKKLTHTLNGSGLAIDRLIATLVEHYYDEEKNLFIWPDILKKYLNINN